MKSFFITGLPRSRTKWFADYFTQGGTPCLHEAFGCSSSQTFNDLLESGIGISDSGLWCYPFLFSDNPDIPVVYIQRDMNFIHTIPANALVIPFGEIDERLKEIHEHCTDIPFDKEFADFFVNVVVKQDQFYASNEAVAKLAGGLG